LRNDRQAKTHLPNNAVPKWRLLSNSAVSMCVYFKGAAGAHNLRTAS
jgi:hypothetical protein